MTHPAQHTVEFGPHLIASPSGALRRAMIVSPSPAIENARPLPGEPNAVHTRARAQMDVFANTLRYFGCEVIELHSPSGDPLASAVGDTAVVFESGAAIMRPSSMMRRPEAARMEEEFVAHDVPIAAHVAPPGLIDGGDVVLAGKTAFIGVSQRSNALGREGFAQIARAHGFSPVEVPLDRRAPSLRAICGVLAHDTLALGAAMYDRGAFDGFEIIETELGDELGAGVFNIGDRHVLADMRFPRVAGALRKRGVRVEAIDLYDFGRIGLTPSVLAVDLKRV